MKFTFSRFICVLTVALTTLSIASPRAQAQTVRQSLFEGGTFDSQTAKDAMYDSNAQRPLYGLFAPNFTRTLTVLGGGNFLTDETANNFTPRSFSSPAFPEVDFLSFEPNTVPKVDNNGYALSFASGRRHNRRLRSEIEVAIRGNQINDVFNFGEPAETTQDGNITATSLMKNFIVDIPNNSVFTPYVGVGIGLSYIDVEFGEASSVDGEATGGDDETLFSYQAIGGVATQLTSAADFIVEYRFLGTAEGDFDGVRRDLSYNSNALFLGVKFEY